MNNFTSSVSQYIKSFGYKIGLNIEDKMFFYMLNEGDLLLINFIMSAFAFKHSIFNRINISFRNDYYAGVLRYEFTTGNDFIQTHKDIFVKDYLKEINDIEYLDLNLAALVAKNNNLKFRVYFDEESGNKIFLDLILGDKSLDLESPSPDSNEYRNYITSENIKEISEVAFADVFDV